MRHISSKEVDATYQRLLKRYRDEGYVNPKAVLDYNIQEMMKEGLTEKEAISHLYKFPEDGRVEREEKKQQAPNVEDLEQKKRDEVKQKIVELRKKISQLTVLFSKGEINEESYKTAVKAVENEMDNLNDELPPVERTQVRRREENLRKKIYVRGEPMQFREVPSDWWWFVPFIFGFFGGYVAYVVCKDRDSEMAMGLLVFGILWSIVPSILGYIYLIPYFLM